MPRAVHRRTAVRALPHPPGTAVVRTLALIAYAAALAACPGREAADQGPPEPKRVESPPLGIALVGYERNGFELVSAEGETIELMRPAEGDEAEATLTYEAGPPQTAGVNLVAAVNEQAAEIESRPDGRFLGQVELGSHLGTAYSTRGRYSGDDGAEIEEIRVFAVHPSGDRLLSLTFRYRPTAGDAKARVEQAMAGLGLVEPLPPPAAGGEEPAAE